MIKRQIELMYLIGDLHYGVHVNSLEWFEYQKQYIYDVLIPEFKKHKDNGTKISVWQMGDVFENKMSLNVNILNKVINMFEDLLKYVDEFNTFIGNHDTYYIDRSDVNSPAILAKCFDNFNVYYKPIELLINNKFKFLILPWMKSTKKLYEEIEATDAKYLLTHIDINDFKYPSGVSIKDNVDPKVLNKFIAVYSGHIHINQKKGNTQYVGTPYALEYSDLGNQKGHHILSFNEDSISETFVPNNVSPVYKAIKFNKFIEMTVEDIAFEFKNSFLYIKTPSKVLNDINVTKAGEFLKANIPDLRRYNFEQYTEIEGLDDMEEVPISDTVDIFEIADDLMEKDEINKEKRGDVLNSLNDLYVTAKNKLQYGEKT